MGSALLELVLLSLPSVIYARRLERAGISRTRARKMIGLQPGTAPPYLIALAMIVPVTAVAALLLNIIPTSVLHGHTKNIVGSPRTASDYAAIVLLALAEEMLFRGFIAGVLFRRFGFGKGNLLQALVFLAPHILLLLVRVALWPLLPLQLIAGLVLGWLRQRSESIGPCWLLHAATNTIPALLFGL